MNTHEEKKHAFLQRMEEVERQQIERVEERKKFLAVLHSRVHIAEEEIQRIATAITSTMKPYTPQTRCYCIMCGGDT